jgi:hypothetical protein
MIYIVNDDIVVNFGQYRESIYVDNDTGYYPLCIRSDAILMSNNKLYIVNNWPRYKLFEIKLKSKEDYSVYPDDFTCVYVKIELEYYKICVVAYNYSYMDKIPIIVKSPSCITGNILDGGYYYVGSDNKLTSLKSKNNLATVLDNDVDIIFFIAASGGFDRYNSVIYKKKNFIICLKCYDSRIINKYYISYDGPSIKKILDKFVLDFDNCVYRFSITDNYEYV